MDTQRVAELIKQIETQERDLAGRQSALASAQRAVTECEAAILELKQALARELAGLLPEARKRRAAAAPSSNAPKSGRQTGIGEAVLALFGDGTPHSIAETDAALRAQGFNPKNTAMQLSMLARAGKLKRVGRGKYAKA